MGVKIKAIHEGNLKLNNSRVKNWAKEANEASEPVR